MEKMSGKRVEVPGVPRMVEVRLQDDGTYLWFMDRDRLHDELHARLFRRPGSSGYHHLPLGVATKVVKNKRRGEYQYVRTRGQAEPGYLLAHIMRCRQVVHDRPGKPAERIWERKGRHDLADILVYLTGGAFVTRAELQQQQETKQKAKKKTESERPKSRSGIRRSY